MIYNKKNIAVLSVLLLISPAALNAQTIDSIAVDSTTETQADTTELSSEPVEPKSFTYALDAQGGFINALGNDSAPSNILWQSFYSHEGRLKNGIYFPTDARICAYTLQGVDQRIGTPVEKYTSPSSVTGFTGIGWRGPVDIAVRGMTRLNNDNLMLALPWSPSKEDSYLYGSFKERHLGGFDLTMHLPVKRVAVDLYSLYLSANQLYENSKDPSLNVNQTTNRDWYTTTSGKISILDTRVMAAGSLLFKDDMADDAAYDLLFGKIGIATDTKLNKRIRFWGGAYGRMYDNRRMAQRGYLVEGGPFKNIGVTGDLRSVLNLKRQLYVKLDLFGDLSEVMTKTKYDLNIRKVWRAQDISSQLGFWSTPGALFPRSCTYYSGTFGIGDQVTVAPQARLYWQWNGLTDAYAYDHTDLNLELSYLLPVDTKKIFTRMSVHGGVDCKLFETNTIGNSVENRLFFSDQIAGYFGVRTYL